MTFGAVSLPGLSGCRAGVVFSRELLTHVSGDGPAAVGVVPCAWSGHSSGLISRKRDACG